mgnify:CR=1 FL=1
MKKIHIIALVITLVLICLTVFSSLKINCSQISCDDIKQLNDLLGIELDSLIIKDISCKTSKNDQYPSTIIDIDIKSNNHELFDYFDTTSQLPSGLISYLEEKGIDINKIKGEYIKANITEDKIAILIDDDVRILNETKKF